MSGAQASRPTRPARAAVAAPRSISTRKGDDGTTGLLFGGERVEKDDLRVEAYGTIDEAVAALGIARAELTVRRGLDVLPPALEELAGLVLELQRELFVAGAELAANPEARDRLAEGTTQVSAAMVGRLDGLLAEYESRIEMPFEFVVPGETRTSAALELARTIVRRAERRTVGLRRAGLVPGDGLLPYLNRLADLLWVLARAAERAEARQSAPARPGGRRRRAAGEVPPATGD